MERKARVGADALLWWSAPHPLDGAPTLEVRHPSLGAIAPAMTPLRADVTLASINASRTVLTAAAPVAGNVRGPQGRYGTAWIVPEGYPARPVRVWSISGDQITLADPLDGVDVAGATLTWSLHYATLPAGTVCSVELRDIPFTVTYAIRYGADVPAEPRRAEGKLHVVRSIFGTALDHARLVYLKPGLAERVPAGQDDFGPQIRAAEAELVTHIRAQLAGRGLFEDDIIGAEQLAPAHAWLASAHLYDDTDTERAERDRSNALRLLQASLESVTLDADGDGVVDEGETGRGGVVRTSSVGGTMPTFDSDTRAAFGMEH